jgi:hypothetical protein
MIAWANLSTFAATLKKGTHLSVEGELRYREFNDKKHKKVKVRLAEIHLGKIGKLDRAAARVAGQWRGDPLLGASALAVLWFGVTHSLEREAPVKTAS